MTQLVEEKLELVQFEMDTSIICESVFGCSNQAIWALITVCCDTQYGVYCTGCKNEMIEEYRSMVFFGLKLECLLCGARGLTDSDLRWNLL